MSLPFFYQANGVLGMQPSLQKFPSKPFRPLQIKD